jgi:hypothetical protein
VVVYRDVGVLCMMMMPNGIGANLPVVVKNVPIILTSK